MRNPASPMSAHTGNILSPHDPAIKQSTAPIRRRFATQEKIPAYAAGNLKETQALPKSSQIIYNRFP